MLTRIALGFVVTGMALFSGCSRRNASSDGSLSAYLAARIYQAGTDTWLRTEPTPADLLPAEKKCLIKKGTKVELKGPPRYRTIEEYHALLASPLPDCALREGYLWMPDFPMNYETPPMPADPFAATRPHLRLHRKGEVEANGLEVLELDLLKPTGETIASISAHSGHGSVQNFRVWRESESGSYEPVPQGEWVIDPLYANNGLTFAGAYGDYETTFFTTDNGESSAALGPVFAPVYYRDFNSSLGDHVSGNPRAMIGIHLDAGNPGTAGCIGLRTVEELKTFVSWLEKPESAPRRLLIDWGL
jgi:hypothetical protein